MIDGEWIILGVDYAGEAIPGRTGRLQLIGPRFSIQIGGSPREVGAVVFDPASEPLSLDLIWRGASGEETRRLRAIVRVRGSLMHFCYFPEAGGARPSTFDSRATSTTPPSILVRCRFVEPGLR